MVTGTFNGASIIALPINPGLQSVEFNIVDAVATVVSPFTGQTQTQIWPGADSITGTATLPPLAQVQADIWVSFLMELRGMANCFQMGDPMRTKPNGQAHGLPVVDMTTTGTNYAGATTLYTRGWTTNVAGQLVPGDYLQVGYRLHKVLERVNSDANGKAQLTVWPSLREVPTDGEAIILKNPTGLFRLGKNQRTWSSDYTRLTHLSFPIQEFR